MSDDPFLSRWSKRKAEAKNAPAASTPVEPAPTSAQVPASAPQAPAPVPLPPVESLTFDSDFTAFMQPGVDAALRRTALKTLLTDPRFNVMDGLDVYIADYSQPDPLPEGWLEQLRAVTHLGHYQPPAEVPEATEEVIPDQPVTAAPADPDALPTASDSPTPEEPKPQ